MGTVLPSLLGQWWRTLTHACAQAEVLALFIERPAEASSGIDASESTHRIIPLFDPPMILFQPDTEIAIAAMCNVRPKYLADRVGVGLLPVGRDVVCCLPNGRNRLPEEPLGRCQIAPLTQHAVNQEAHWVDVAALASAKVSTICGVVLGSSGSMRSRKASTSANSARLRLGEPGLEPMERALVRRWTEQRQANVPVGDQVPGEELFQGRIGTAAGSDAHDLHCTRSPTG
jgi:hypothetical protein